jgi:NADPH:quinone reductase-like Zn-dependent oxidoreductase
MRSGALAAFMPVNFPASLGMDASGVVNEFGAGVAGVAVGEEVFGSTVTGALAQYAVLRVEAGYAAQERAAGMTAPTG